MSESSNKEISVVGHCCPMPLVELSKAAKHMTKPSVLTITGDDPIFEAGVRDFCTINQHEVVNVEQMEHGQVKIEINIHGGKA